MNYHITLDIDWAPDLAICHCLEILKKKIKATFFNSKTDLLKKFRKMDMKLNILTLQKIVLMAILQKK